MARCQVYIHLLDEGVTVVRPTEGIDLGDGRCRVLPTAQYDPEDEQWEFPPGCVVRCEKEKWEGKEILVAKARVDEP